MLAAEEVTADSLRLARELVESTRALGQSWSRVHESLARARAALDPVPECEAKRALLALAGDRFPLAGDALTHQCASLLLPTAIGLALLLSASRCHSQIGAEFTSLEQQVVARPDDREVRRRLAQAYAGSGFVEEAAEQYLILLSREADDADAKSALTALLKTHMPSWLPAAVTQVTAVPSGDRDARLSRPQLLAEPRPSGNCSGLPPGTRMRASAPTRSTTGPSRASPTATSGSPRPGAGRCGYECTTPRLPRSSEPLSRRC